MDITTLFDVPTLLAVTHVVVMHGAHSAHTAGWGIVVLVSIALPTLATGLSALGAWLSGRSSR